MLKAEKQRLKKNVEQVTDMKLSELAGLYCYFLGISHSWMAENGIAGWLIPAEFMYVNYGQQIKKYLLTKVTLLRIHRFDPEDIQFNDALVTSAVVWFRKTPPSATHSVEFTYGGTLTNPKISNILPVDKLRDVDKWAKFPAVVETIENITKNNVKALPVRKTQKDTLISEDHQGDLTLSSLFDIKRGLATGANEFFIITQEQIARHQLPAEVLIPILPGPRYLEGDEIKADAEGNPLLEKKLFLLGCNLSEGEIQMKYPSLWEYLQSGIKDGVNKRYLCSHRTPWYSQENRPAPVFLCTYMGRQRNKEGNPFRFILNHSKATAANVYLLLYPGPSLQRILKERPDLIQLVWQGLRNISSEMLMNEGRVYGGGLHKVEPKELSNVSARSIIAALQNCSAPSSDW
jgi:hypothetical protein